MCGMGLPLIWPRISDKTSARRAVKAGFWMCALLAVLYTVMGTYLLVSRRPFRDYDPSLGWVFYEFGALSGLVAWRLWKNSRVWAVIGLVLVALGYHDKLRSVPGAVIPVFFLLVLFNTARGTFAFHKYDGQQVSTPLTGIADSVAQREGTKS